MNAKQPTSVSLEAKIIRADGTVVDLGCIAFHHRNPLRRWAWRVAQFFRGREAGRVFSKG